MTFAPADLAHLRKFLAVKVQKSGGFAKIVGGFANTKDAGVRFVHTHTLRCFPTRCPLHAASGAAGAVRYQALGLGLVGVRLRGVAEHAEAQAHTGPRERDPRPEDLCREAGEGSEEDALHARRDWRLP